MKFKIRMAFRMVSQTFCIMHDLFFDPLTWRNLPFETFSLFHIFHKVSPMKELKEMPKGLESCNKDTL